MKSIKAQDIKRNWHLVDAKDKVLGRISSQIAMTLMGKNKSYYVPYLDTGDYVVVINAQKITLTGKKEDQKKYWRHSGYPGGLRFKKAGQVRAHKPEDLIRHAVCGMLPKNTLGTQMLKKLFVYPKDEHPYNEKFKDQKSNVKITS